MNAREFEQRFLELVFRTNAKLTPHVIAYRFGIPFAEAKEHLENLAKNGVVEMEVDDSGQIRYEVPGVERPERDLMAESGAPRAVPPPRPATKPGQPGQWFSGPASSYPPPRPVIIAAPPRRPSMGWLWLPAVIMGSLFVMPIFLTLFFLFLKDFLGVFFFFMMGFCLMKMVRGGRSSYRCGRSDYPSPPPPGHHHRNYPF